MNWTATPAIITLLLLATTAFLCSAESHEGRRNGSKHRRRGKTTTTTTTPEPFDQLADDNVDATALQDQPGGSETCEIARLKCAYRQGCGMALQNYMVGCSDVITGASQRCSDHCRNSLIALTSTEEGEALMKCKCSDSFCKDAKQRVDVCRSAVLRATHNSTTVSCSVAQWICAADPLCSTALDYYNRFCRSMFAGKKCTLRCKNSISILRRQEKAAKLSTCVCDGSEDYDCPAILDNMDRLCFHKVRPSTSLDIASTSTTAASPHHHQTVLGGGPGVEEHNSVGNSSDQGRAGHGGHQQSGHRPHHPQTRPHHPHQPHHHDTESIESNEVERPPPTQQWPPKSGGASAAVLSSSVALLLSLAISLAL